MAKARLHPHDIAIKVPLAEWSNATDLRSVSFGSAGSNPAGDIVVGSDIK